MKASKLLEQIKTLIKKHGDLEVAFYEGSINPDVDPEYSIHPCSVLGAYKVQQTETGRTKKSLVLAATWRKDSIGFDFSCDPAPLKRG